jgi:hypothetical protein
MILCIIFLFALLCFLGNPWDDFLFILVIFGFNVGIYFFNMINPKGGLVNTAAIALWTMGASVVSTIACWIIGFLLYFTRVWELIVRGCYKILFGESLPIGIFYSGESANGFHIFWGILYLIWFIRNIYLIIKLHMWKYEI